MIEATQVVDDEQKARSRPRLGVASFCTESEPAAPVVNFVLRHSGLEREEMTKDILPFPLSTCPTAAEISLSLEVGRARLGQAEEEEAMVKRLFGHGQHLSTVNLFVEWLQHIFLLATS